jgi:methionyl-tRNA formyltransferase
MEDAAYRMEQGGQVSQTSESDRPSQLRIVTFNNLPGPFRITQGWAAQAGHKVVLAVTTPGPAARRSESYREILAAAPTELDLLVTTRIRRVALPLIRELRPDLILSFTFPYRLPPELRALARIGAVNLHPTVLPAYRGPNPMRAIYDGYPLLGATLHWTEDDFDTGAILSQHSAPLPTDLSIERVFTTWAPLMGAALAEGVARAVAGEPGTPQDDAGASYGAAFGAEEHWLDWRDPGYRLQQKCVALTMIGAAARARIGEGDHRIARITPIPDPKALHPPGTVLSQDHDGLTIACGDGAVRVVVQPLASG